MAAVVFASPLFLFAFLPLALALYYLTPNKARNFTLLCLSLLFYAWSHSRNFRPSEIRAWLEEAGFARVDVHRNERSPWRVVVIGR